MILAAVSLGLAVAAGWFHAEVRPEKAASFDAEAAVSLERDDYRQAYRQSRFANALEPSPERRLALGSISYLNGTYEESFDHFKDLAADEGSALQTKARLGAAAAAARAGDRTNYDRFRALLGDPEDREIRAGLAHAALDAADFPTVSRLARQEETFVRLVGMAAEDPAAVSLASSLAEKGDVPSGKSAYDRFFRRLTAVPDDHVGALTAASGRMSQAASAASRKLYLAQALAGLDELSAAESLALQAVKEQVGYRDGWTTLAAVQLRLGKRKEAGRSLKTALDLDDANGYAWYLKARLAEAEGQARLRDDFDSKARDRGYVPQASPSPSSSPVP